LRGARIEKKGLGQSARPRVKKKAKVQRDGFNEGRGKPKGNNLRRRIDYLQKKIGNEGPCL